MNDNSIDLKLTLEEIHYITKCIYVYKREKELNDFFRSNVNIIYFDHNHDSILNKLKESTGNKMIWDLGI
jgi:hypothetical protein